MNQCWKTLLEESKYMRYNFPRYISDDMTVAIDECENDLNNHRTEICGFCATERFAGNLVTAQDVGKGWMSIHGRAAQGTDEVGDEAVKTHHAK